MATTINATIQFKRGSAARWEELNPVLLSGEPGFEKDTGRFKLGDGITHWKDLPYQGENAVVNAKTHYDFPSLGRANTIYKAEQEKILYQWNTTALKYEALGSTGGTLDIDIINGGNASEHA